MKKPALANLGQRLRFAREEVGFTQEQLAKIIGSSWTTIASIEQRGAVRTTKALELANALAVRVEWLERGEEPMRNPPPPSESALDLARRIDNLPPQIQAMVRAMVDSYEPADDPIRRLLVPAKLTK